MSLGNGEVEGGGVWLSQEAGWGRLCLVEDLRIFTDIRAAVGQDSRQRVTQPATSSETAPLAVV